MNYLGDREIAYRKGSILEYVCQDNLGSTAVTVNTSGNAVARIAYFPFGVTRSLTGGLNTDKRFTGQRLDDTGLYFYNARYYDAAIGRFISADTVTPDYKDPQDLNPYAYCRNNPLKYTDPTGEIWGFAARVFNVVAPPLVKYLIPRILGGGAKPVSTRPGLTGVRSLFDPAINAYTWYRNNPYFYRNIWEF